MNTFTLAAFFLLYIVVSDQASVMKTCNCWAQFIPVQTVEGTMYCQSHYLPIMMPCNIVKPPACKCTKSIGTVVVNNDSDVYCYNKNDNKKWECENQEEWEAFFKEAWSTLSS